MGKILINDPKYDVTLRMVQSGSRGLQAEVFFACASASRGNFPPSATWSPPVATRVRSKALAREFPPATRLQKGFWKWTGRKTSCTFQMQRYTHRWNSVQSHWINEGETATINYNCVNSFRWRLDLDCHMAVVVVYFLFIKRSRTSQAIYITFAHGLMGRNKPTRYW